jgi:cytochrome c biogenesis protein CcdA
MMASSVESCILAHKARQGVVKATKMGSYCKLKTNGFYIGFYIVFTLVLHGLTWVLHGFHQQRKF